jgi:hypothetical protein
LAQRVAAGPADELLWIERGRRSAFPFASAVTQHSSTFLEHNTTQLQLKPQGRKKKAHERGVWHLLATKVGRLALIAQVKGEGIDGVLGRILLRSGIILHALHVQPLLFEIKQVGSHVLANLFTRGHQCVCVCVCVYVQ